MRRVVGPRTVVEAAFLVAVPVMALESGLSAWPIVGVSAAAYVLVVAVEASLARLRGIGPAPSSEPLPDPKPKSERRPKPVRELALPAPIGISGPATRWSVWDLEDMAKKSAGGDAAADEDRFFLLLHLREFAGADGLLPTNFDALVRESFGELAAS